MAFVKCPRCELNYMQDTEKYCEVCRREMKGEDREELFDSCSVCGENPALPGKDMCLFCLKEMGKNNEPDEELDEAVADEPNLELGSASTMDEIAMDVEADIPPREYGEITRELSLQEALEEEEAQEEDEEEEDE